MGLADSLTQEMKLTHLKDLQTDQRANAQALKAYASLLHIIVVGDKQVAKFVTPSGVTGIVATNVSNELMARLRKRLEGKLRRSGHLTNSATVHGSEHSLAKN